MSTLIPKEKEKIVEFIVDNPTKKIKVREAAKQLKLSPAHISRTLKTLVANNIVRDNKVDLANPYVKALKIFFNIKKLTEKNIMKKLKELKATSAGVYGSWANGTNYEDSDLDIWIKVNSHPRETKIATISNEIRRAIGKNTQILVLTKDRIERLRKEDPMFYYSLVFSSIILYGETIE